MSRLSSDSDVSDGEYGGDAGTLELRLKVDRAFGISREVGLAWFEAVRYGDATTIKRLLADAKARDRSAPVSSSGQSTFTERLVNYNGQATSYGFVGSTALHWACANCDVTIAELLLGAGASVNVQNFGGSTPLHSACANGQPEMVRLLLQHGANPSIVDCCGDRPADVVNPGLPRKERSTISALLAAHGEIDSMLRAVGGPAGLESCSPEKVPWTGRQMQALLVATGAVPGPDAAPKEASALREQALAVMASVAKVRERSELADAKAAALQAKVSRRLEAQRKRVAAARADSSSDDEAAAAPRQPRVPRSAAAAVQAEVEAAEAAKAKGNECFQSGDFKGAVRYYTTALGITGGTGEHDATFYSNRAAAHMKLGKPVQALEDARKAVALKPAWAKAHHRVGTAAAALGQHHEAAAAFRAGLTLVPGDESLRTGLQEAEAALAAAPAPASRPTPSAPAAASAPVATKPPPADLGRFKPGERKPWFECVLCENRTRDHAATPCCELLVCGTCAKRRFGGGNRCPFCSA